MGDRYYRQMCEYGGVKPGELMAAQRNPLDPESIKIFNKIYNKLNGTTIRATDKKALVEAFFHSLMMPYVTGFDKLTIKTLKAMLDNEPVFNESWTMPTGRTRAPYEQAMKSVFPNSNIDLKPLTIKAMKEFLTNWGFK